MTPPPGWYPDPHGPHLERWWDGTAWTEHRRTPGASTAPARGGGTGRTKTVALTAAGAVLVAAIVTGAVALSGGDGSGTETRTAPTPTSEATPGSPEPAPEAPASEPSADDPAVVEDQLNGVTFPLRDGWVRPQHVAQDDVVMTTDGTYDCPAGVGLCRHGMVFSRTVTENDEKSPEALAKADISEAADDAYDRDQLGRELYGGLRSHQVVKSGPVAVAGRAGYLVRWRVKTAEGPGGYVQSMVFLSTVGTDPVTASPSTRCSVSNRSHSSPALACRNHTLSPISRSSAGEPSSGVCTSPAPS